MWISCAQKWVHDVSLREWKRTMIWYGVYDQDGCVRHLCISQHCARQWLGMGFKPVTFDERYLTMRDLKKLTRTQRYAAIMYDMADTGNSTLHYVNKENVARWYGKQRGYESRAGGWIYNNHMHPVCQGWGSLFVMRRVDIACLLRDM